MVPYDTGQLEYCLVVLNDTEAYLMVPNDTGWLE